MMDVAAGALSLLGSFLCLSAVVGVFRLPTVLARLHAASKSVSLGITCIIAAAVAANPSVDVLLKGLLSLTFILLTIPIASHLIASTLIGFDEDHDCPARKYETRGGHGC